MDLITSYLAAFLIERGRVLFLIVSILVLLEGMLYIFFPEKIKKIINKCSLGLIRLAGITIFTIGFLLIFVYALIFNNF